jgi:pimeloyl-ACP methyl ester carboxylesterase
MAIVWDQTSESAANPPTPSNLALSAVMTRCVQLALTGLYLWIVLEARIPTWPSVASAFSVMVAAVFLLIWYRSPTWKRLAPLAALPALVFAVATVASNVAERSERKERVTISLDLRQDVAGDRVAPETLIVFLHGMGGSGLMDQFQSVLNLNEQLLNADWSALDDLPEKAALSRGVDMLGMQYQHAGPFFSMFSNADPEAIAEEIHRRLVVHCGKYKRIVLVGHSMGALLIRKTYLIGRTEAEANNDDAHWARKTKRIVLMAGMNRGWSIAGQRPLDMGVLRYLLLWLGSNIADWTGTAKLAMQMESGSPFVANLRLDWVNLSRKPGLPLPQCVQLLGDIDDLVAESDNMDLHVTGTAGFCWLRVRGTGHAEIIQIDGRPDGGEDEKIRYYRQKKVALALTLPFEKLKKLSEIQPAESDRDVKRVVFVLHGIRDYGRWSAFFDDALQEDFDAKLKDRLNRKEPGVSDKDKLAIVSPRYGYFGMGPFVLAGKRAAKVRWFMDAYAENYARYPKAERIDFFGHSNGTYLLARGLANYRSLRVDRIVFAGSVVPRNYPWTERFKPGRDGKAQVESVRNYVASEDWVVALFPRFFESWFAAPFNNDLGSAGFNGFEPPGKVPDINKAVGNPVHFVQNVGSVRGPHSAFEYHVKPIVEFLSSDQCLNVNVASEEPAGWHSSLQWISDWAVLLVWLLLAGAIVWPLWCLSFAVPVTPQTFTWKMAWLWPFHWLTRCIVNASLAVKGRLANRWPVWNTIWPPVAMTAYLVFVLWLLNTY